MNFSSFDFFERELEECTGELAPVPADPWIVTSLLQKAIRRGEVALAERAACTSLVQRGSAVWRRLVIIAFEDVGIGSTDALELATAAARRSWREQFSDDARIVRALARYLAIVAKDRSTDYLVGAADHPSVTSRLSTKPFPSLDQALECLADNSIELSLRSAAVSVIAGGLTVAGRAGVRQLMNRYAELGASETLLSATEQAAIMTREPITVVLPLIWLAAAGLVREVMDLTVPPLRVISGVPAYALDKHTRAGRLAISGFATRNTAVRSCLERFVVPARRRHAAFVAAFYADAAPISRKLLWPGCERIETFGRERDMYVAGAPLESAEALIRVVAENLDDLNDIRASVLDRQSELAGTGNG